MKNKQGIQRKREVSLFQFENKNMFFGFDSIDGDITQSISKYNELSKQNFIKIQSNY